MKPYSRRSFTKSASHPFAALFSIWSSIRHAQAQEGASTTNSALYIVPPSTNAISSTTSTFNYWWPFPTAPASSSTPSSTGLTGSSSISSASSSGTAFAFFPTVTVSLNSSAFSLVNSSSSIPSTPSNPSSSTSDSVIRITATTSSTPQTSPSSHPFKLIYLTPLFAILGLVSGATFSGMLYGWRTRRILGRDEQDEFGELDMLANVSPPSRAGRDELEEGYGQIDKEARASHADSKYLHPGSAYNNSPQGHVHSVTSSPSEYGPTPTGIRLNDGIARPWYDRLPGLSAQVSSYQAAVPQLSPSWATADLVSPSSVANDARDIRSHSSIRRAIADRLGVGTRRVGSRKESAQAASPNRSVLALNTGAEDVAVRRASGQQYRENGSATLQRRPQKGMSSTLESRYRKVVEEFDSVTSPGRFAPGDDDHKVVNEREIWGDDSAYIRLATGATRVTSGSSVIAPKSSRSGSNTKLRVKSRQLVSPNDADHSVASLDSDVLPKRKLRRRSDLTPISPTLSYEPYNQDERPTLRLLSPPPRVISPPAHPELFFADPVLGEYVGNTPLQLHRDNGRTRRHSAGTNAEVGGGRQQAKLHRQKPSAYTGDLGGTLSDSNGDGDGDGTKSTAESERTPASVSTASAFYGRPMKPARTHEALGAVNAIMKTGWSVREDTKSAEQAEHQREKMRQPSGAGLGNPRHDGEMEESGAHARRQGWREASNDLPPMTTSTAQRSGIVGERIRQLLERTDAA